MWIFTNNHVQQLKQFSFSWMFTISHELSRRKATFCCLPMNSFSKSNDGPLKLNYITWLLSLNKLMLINWWSSIVIVVIKMMIIIIIIINHCCCHHHCSSSSLLSSSLFIIIIIHHHHHCCHHHHYSSSSSFLSSSSLLLIYHWHNRSQSNMKDHDHLQ